MIIQCITILLIDFLNHLSAYRNLPIAQSF